MKGTLSCDDARQSSQKTQRARSGHARAHGRPKAIPGMRATGLPALIAASALVLANLSAAAPGALLSGFGDGLVGTYGDLDRIAFEGVTTFDREALRDSLAQNAGFLLASHSQAPLGQFLDILRQKILAGYQQNGFPNASVTAAPDTAGRRVQVRVSEGTRYRCGKVRVTGTKPAPAAAIVARLTKPAPGPSKTYEAIKSIGGHAPAEVKTSENGALRIDAEAQVNVERHDPREALAATRKPSDDSPLWAPGEPGAFGDACAKQIDEAVKDCLAEYGLFFPQVKSGVKLNPDNRTADLLVEVLDEGPAGTVSEIEVTGNRKNTREEVLKFLGLKRGMAITRSRLAEAEGKLWRSARFLHYEIKPEPAGSGLTKATGVRLSVKVKEYEPAPKLTARLSPEQQAVLRLCEWLSDFRSRKEDLALSCGTTGQKDPVRLAADIVISPSQGALIKLRERAAPSTADYSVLLARETLGIYAHNRGGKCFIRQPDIASEAVIEFAPGAVDNPNPINFMLGAGCRRVPDTDVRIGNYSPFRLNLKLAPVAFLYLLEGTNQVLSVKGKALTLLSSNHVLRADARTGRLEQLRIQNEESWFEASFATGAFDRAQRELSAVSAGWSNRYVPDYPLSSVASFGLLELARWSVLDKVITNLPPAQRQPLTAAVNKLLGPTVLAPFDQWMSATNQAESFTIPVDDVDRALSQNSLSAVYAAVAFRYCNKLFPKDSWPWTIARESVFVLAGHSTYTEAEVMRLYESEDTGPLGLLVLAELLTKMNPATARNFAVKGLTRLSAVDFRADCRLLLEGDSGLARAFANLATVLREMPAGELAALVSVLPAEEAGLVVDAAESLKSAPDQSLGKSLGPALENYWDKCLRGRVRAALQRISGATSDAAVPRI